MKNVCCFFLLSLLYASTYAQFLTPQSYGSMSTKLLFLEIKGNGGKFSLNYEQLIAMSDHAAASTRFGISAFPAGNQRFDFGIPMTVSGLFGGGNLFGEIGAGTSILFSNNLMEEGAEITPTGILGIRYHPDYKGGLLLRFGYTPFLKNTQLQHGWGFSVGLGLGS